MNNGSTAVAGPDGCRLRRHSLHPLFMSKLALITLNVCALLVSACNQSRNPQPTAAEAKRAAFYGEVWVRPGNRNQMVPSGTYYLNPAASAAADPVKKRSLSSFSLWWLFGGRVAKSPSERDAHYYISHTP